MNEPEMRFNKRKPHRTWEEKNKLCAQWRSSGLTKSEFCRSKDLSIATLCNWLEKSTQKIKKHNKIKFLPISKIANEPQESKLEIRLPNGLVICFSVMPETQKIKDLIEELQHVTDHSK
jgi:hypothetical protein